MQAFGECLDTCLDTHLPSPVTGGRVETPSCCGRKQPEGRGQRFFFGGGPRSFKAHWLYNCSLCVFVSREARIASTAVHSTNKRVSGCEPVYDVNAWDGVCFTARGSKWEPIRSASGASAPKGRLDGVFFACRPPWKGERGPDDPSCLFVRPCLAPILRWS